jgi:hypothetical protein
MNLFFWMLLNLGVPIVGPIFTLALVAPTYGSRVAKALIAASVKDGQLFWCAIGLCAAAIYETVAALEQGSRETSMLVYSIAGFCALAFACSILVMSGLLNVRHDREEAGVGEKKTDFVVGTFPRVAIVVSIFLACLVATLFAILHMRLNLFF